MVVHKAAGWYFNFVPQTLNWIDNWWNGHAHATQATSAQYEHMAWRNVLLKVAISIGYTIKHDTMISHELKS